MKTRAFVILTVLAGIAGEASASPAAPTATPTAAPPAPAAMTALPGTVVRWSVPGTKRCVMGARSWAALQETCYYPVDLAAKSGLLRVSRLGTGPAAHARIQVLPATHPSEDIVLGDIPQAKPSAADLKRNVRDQALVSRVWTKREGPAQFTLPLASPAARLPDGKGFGSMWMFNSPPGSSELHNGSDYALPPGTPLLAVAAGTVALAADLFYAGNAIFIDHGNGLVSMYFHLSELKVHTGQAVKKGETIGVSGSTGRITGPHLHLGLRWHDARIDPALLLADPAKIPAVLSPQSASR